MFHLFLQRQMWYWFQIISPSPDVTASYTLCIQQLLIVYWVSGNTGLWVVFFYFSVCIWWMKLLNGADTMLAPVLMRSKMGMCIKKGRSIWLWCWGEASLKAAACWLMHTRARTHSVHTATHNFPSGRVNTRLWHHSSALSHQGKMWILLVVCLGSWLFQESQE